MDTRSVRRRRVLRALAGASTVAGLASLPAVTAQGEEEAEEADDSGDRLSAQPHVDTVNDFELQADGTFSVTAGNSRTNYETKGVGFPWNASELVVHLHAWNASYEGGLVRSRKARSAYSDIWWYDPGVVGVTWGTTDDVDLAGELAGLTAPKIASFLSDFHYWNPDVDIRLQGFSMGAKLLAETLVQLDEWDERDVVTSAIFLAGAIRGGSVSLDGDYGTVIERTVDHAENFWDREDIILRYRFYYEANRGAIGNEGSSGPTPENYTDHEVTDAIDGHEYRNWLDPAFLGEWVVPEIVDRRNFGLQIDRDGPGVSGVRSG